MSENTEKKMTKKEISKELGIEIPNGETVSAETVNEFKGNKGDE